MLHRLKKRAWETVLEGPAAMEVTQSSPTQPDPRQPPLEVPEESIHREQPPGNPRTESLDTEEKNAEPSSTFKTKQDKEVILELLRDISEETKQFQDDLLSEMGSVRASISQIQQWVGVVESRLSSLEDRASESQQIDSIISASQSDSRGVPAASSPSFSSHQMILDAAQRTVSPSLAPVYTGGASIEPAASSTLVYVETEEESLQTLADLSSQESETPCIEAEESDHQEDALSGASPQEYNPEPQPSPSTFPEAHQILSAAWSQERTSESEIPCTEAEESDHQEDTLSGASPQEYNPEPQPSTSTLPEAHHILSAVWSQERTSESETPCTEAVESDHQVDTFSGVSTQEYQPEPWPSMSTLPETPQLTAPAAVQKKAPLRTIQSSRRHPTKKKSGRSPLTPTTTSAGPLGHLASSPPEEVKPPTKRRRKSMVWDYFTKRSKFTAFCSICKVDVKTGKIGGCGNVGTASLLSHLKRVHGIVREKVAPSLLPAAVSESQNMERSSSIESLSRNV